MPTSILVWVCYKNPIFSGYSISIKTMKLICLMETGFPHDLLCFPACFPYLFHMFPMMFPLG